jgi:hypothetical protein
LCFARAARAMHVVDRSTCIPNRKPQCSLRRVCDQPLNGGGGCRRRPSAIGAPVEERHTDKLLVTARPLEPKLRRLPTSLDPPSSIPPPGACCLAPTWPRAAHASESEHESEPRLGAAFALRVSSVAIAPLTPSRRTTAVVLWICFPHICSNIQTR